MEEEKQIQHDDEEVHTPSYSPHSSSSSSSPPSSSPSKSSPTNLSSPPRRTKSLKEIYEDSRKHLNEDLMNFALFANTDLISFEDAAKEKKWRNAIDQEIDAIQRNKTWELVEFPRGKKRY